MAELSKRAQALIDAARTADDPTPEGRARGDAAVRVALSMHGLTDLPPLAPPRPDPPVNSAAGAEAIAHGGLGVKIGVGAALLLSATLFVVVARPSTTPPKRAAGLDAPGIAAHVPPPPLAGEVPALPERQPPASAARSDPPARERARARRTTASNATLEAEVRLISAANRLVRASRFDDALRVLEEHTQRFANGALGEERRALRVLSLCGSGAPHARAQRERFLRNAPSSVLAERVRAACAAEAP